VSRREQTCQQAIAQVVDARVDPSLCWQRRGSFICTPLALLFTPSEQLIPYLCRYDFNRWVRLAPVVEAIAPFGPICRWTPAIGKAVRALKPLWRIMYLKPVATHQWQPEDQEKPPNRWDHCLITCLMTNRPDRAAGFTSHGRAGLIAACMRETDPGVLALAQHQLVLGLGYQPWGAVT